MAKPPLYVTHENLSVAWARAFLEALRPGEPEIVPLVVTITGFESNRVRENDEVRNALDMTLLANGKDSCDTVAKTIFPYSFWNPNKSREEFYERYADTLSTLKRADARNKYGMYFERLIRYGKERFNQLEHVISTYKRGNHRRTALQVAVFNPATDHTNQLRRGFPCLQHVTFVPFDGGKLAITGFYASQYLFTKAYGNYLGLAWLGHFIAHELDMVLSQVTCVSSVAQLEVPKKEVTELSRKIEELVARE